jgi:signal transduction histidine kinase
LRFLRIIIITYWGKEAKVVLVTDITERRQYIQAMEAQNKKLKKIAWTQSHVLRSPLSNILGLAQMLKNEGGTFKEKKRKEFLGHLLLSANTLDEAISEIVVDS